MLFKKLKWAGLLFLLLGALSFRVVAQQQDIGPLPPPEGPFFSSKPLLYFGDEPSVYQAQSSRAPRVQEGRMRGYPYPPSGRGFFQQMAPPSQTWGAQRPYYPAYQEYPAYFGQQGYPNRYRYPAFPPFSGQGRR